MIHSTMAVARTVDTAAWLTLSQVSRRCIAATTIAPKLPMPAASTGVAAPEKDHPQDQGDQDDRRQHLAQQPQLLAPSPPAPPAAATGRLPG